MRIDGECLVGFGDFFSGYDDVGAVASRPTAPGKKPSAKGKPSPHKGNVPVKKAVVSKNVSPHKTALANTARAAKQAVNVSKHIEKATAQYKSRIASGAHRPVVSARGLATGIVPHTVALVGATTTVPAKLTPKQKAAVQRHAMATKLLAKAKKNAAVAASKAGHVGAGGLSFVKVTVPAVQKALTIQGFRGSKPTTVHGLVGEYINSVGGIEHLTDEEVVALGQAISPAPTDSPSTPTDATAASDQASASDDASAAGLPTDQSSATDSTSGVVTGPDGNVLYDPATDQEVVPMPQHGQDLTQDELKQVWETVPDDGFVYQEGAQVYPVNAVGSWNTFFGPQWKSGWGRGYIYGAHSSWMYPGSSGPPGMENDEFVDGTFGNTAEVQKYSVQQNGWGPLIGNPNGPLKNLQFAQKDQKWFWQSKAVDPAMAADADAKIASANQQTIAANRASAVAVAKQMYADKMQAAEQKAKQDADNALAESQATSQANVAQTQEQAKQAGVETQAQQALVEQQQADTAAQQAETQAEAAAAQEIVAQAKMQREQPDLYAQIYGGGGDETMDDGSEIPGGDMMQDADGEGYQDDGDYSEG